MRRRWCCKGASQRRNVGMGEISKVKKMEIFRIMYIFVG